MNTLLAIYLTGAVTTTLTIFVEDDGLMPLGYLLLGLLWPITVPIGVVVRMSEIHEKLRSLDDEC